jgi:TPR repeat protein
LKAYSAKDFATAVEILRPIADSGDRFAQCQVAVMYLRGEGVAVDIQTALKWFKASAAQGFANAETYLGSIYRRGDGVPQDYAEAMRWYLAAAEQGHRTAQYRIALLYLEGNGVTKSSSEAYKWSVIASSSGEPEPNRLRHKLERSLSPQQIEDEQKKARDWVIDIQTERREPVGTPQHGPDLGAHLPPTSAPIVAVPESKLPPISRQQFR